MVVYICGPYTAPTRDEVQRNINVAERAGKAVLKMGHTPLIPHRISAHWDDDPEFNPEEWTHTAWMEKLCLPLLSKCDAILMLDGWPNSKGSVMEFEYACQLDLRIHTLETITEQNV